MWAEHRCRAQFCDAPPLPPIRSNLRAAFFAEREILLLTKAVGRVSGSFLTPLIHPGAGYCSR